MQDSHRRRTRPLHRRSRHAQTNATPRRAGQAGQDLWRCCVGCHAVWPAEGRAIHSSICALVELLSARSRHCKMTSFITPANAPTRCTSLAPVDADRPPAALRQAASCITTTSGSSISSSGGGGSGGSSVLALVSQLTLRYPTPTICHHRINFNASVACSNIRL